MSIVSREVKTKRHCIDARRSLIVLQNKITLHLLIYVLLISYSSSVSSIPCAIHSYIKHYQGQGKEAVRVHIQERNSFKCFRKILKIAVKHQKQTMAALIAKHGNKLKSLCRIKYAQIIQMKFWQAKTWT